MVNPVWHVELGIELELDRDDLGHPHLPGLWERVYADKRRPVSARGLMCAGICRDLGAVSWMHLRQRANGRREAVHEHAEDEARHTAPVSEEHKAYVERIIRVAENAGHQAAPEVTAPGRRIRTDVIIEGANGIRIGGEVQRSDISEPSVRYRANRARDLGITPWWHTDRRDLGNRGDIHWTRSDNLPPEVIRQGHALKIWTGVRHFEWERCDRTRAIPCPAKRVGRCGRLHPRPEPHPIEFDDLVRDASAGDLVPIEFKLSTRTNRFWVPTQDRDRYLDSLDGDIDLTRDPRPIIHVSTTAPTCRPTTPQPAPTRDRLSCSWCGATQNVRLYAAGRRCPSHTPAALRGLPEPGQGRHCPPNKCYCGTCIR